MPVADVHRWSRSRIDQVGRGRGLEERWVLRYPSAAAGGGPSPFPGLRAFGVAEHEVFFARNREIAELAGLLGSAQDRGEPSVTPAPRKPGPGSVATGPTP